MGGRSQPRTLSPGIGELAQVLTFVGLCSYAVSWVFCTFAFSRFSVQPEDIGLGLEFLLVRSSVLTGIITAVVSVAALLNAGAWLTRGKAGDLRPFNIAATTLTASFFTITVLVSLVAVYYTWPNMPRIVLISLVLPVALIVSIIHLTLLLRAVNIAARRSNGASLGRPDFTLLVGYVICWLLLLVPCSAIAGTAVGRQLEGGHPIQWPLLSIPLVSVSDLEGTPVAPFCALELGQSDHTVVFYEPHTATLSKLPRSSVISTIRAESC